MRLSLQVARPKLYPENPATLGEHLLKARHMAGMTQVQVADQLGVNEWTYLLWENDRAEPLTRYYPAIFGFLGYDPFPAPTTLAEQIAAKRRQLGLPIKRAAKLLGVDEGTFAGWESGKRRPALSQETVIRFLRASQISDLQTTS